MIPSRKFHYTYRFLNKGGDAYFLWYLHMMSDAGALLRGDAGRQEFAPRFGRISDALAQSTLDGTPPAVVIQWKSALTVSTYSSGSAHSTA